MYYIKAAAYENFKGALGAKSWEFRSPTYEVKGVAMKNSGAHSYSSVPQATGLLLGNSPGLDQFNQESIQ